MFTESKRTQPQLGGTDWDGIFIHWIAVKHFGTLLENQ